ncbi:hypothetical protein HPP92_000630 [Vanilla planifolia]|uniref:Uncharacterized protein n=1 Tax=Vanilla planifolia TaxID=51239 RepID=A0A835VKS9_VANPL|nr:hypothetical protein HPP92_000709 [Vanilla planifolia]KAG0500558.1 hypothetical protein HPP92_000630 [Vanilla planifolia]
MDTLSSVTLWGYQESLDELRDKLWTASCELEEVKSNARHEIREKEESIKHLTRLVWAASQERDQARKQLRLLLEKLERSTSIEVLQGSSSVTKSENFSSEGHNVSSPAVGDSIEVSNVSAAEPFDAAVSPQLKMCACTTPFCSQDELMKTVFEQFAKKPLPEKGRLVEAVINAGPLLETLFLSGSLPQWKKPPPLKPVMIPPPLIRGSGGFLCK